jgi:very-short-patch-repair endonuclease
MNVTCQICERGLSGMKGLSTHIRSHEISYEKYVKKYVDHVPTYSECEVCGEVTKSKGNENFTTCSRACQAEWKRQNWQGENAPRYGKTHTEDTKKKIGKKAKERLSDSENHPMYGKHHSEETRKKISESHKKLYKSGYENPMKGKTHDTAALRKIFNSWEISKRELEFKQILDSLNVEYKHQFFLSRDGVNRSYDFYLPGAKVLVEIDGDYWHGGPGCDEHCKNVDDVRENDQFKQDFAEKHGYRVIRFWGSEIKSQPQKVTEQIKKFK